MEKLDGTTFGPEARAQLQKHMAVPMDQQGSRWNAFMGGMISLHQPCSNRAWINKQTLLPWDRGLSSPALVDALKDKQDVIGSPVVDGKRRVALVPGCGRGYDVLLLASLGYDAYGLEISEKAIEACKEFAGKEWSRYAANAGADGRGKYEFVLGDFFKNEFLEARGMQPGDIDFIYDYTFACALPPAARPNWARRHNELLSSRGRLVCLEFPTYKPPSTGGPPYGINPDVYVAHLTRPGQEIEYSDEGVPADTSDSGKGLERIAHWQPERTHEVGQGTDWVSVWKQR